MRRSSLTWLPALVLGLVSVPKPATGQTIAEQCTRVLPPSPTSAGYSRPSMEPDSAFLGLLNPVYYHDAWPGRAALDSIREADSGRYFATLAFMITDHGYYFGAHNASAAAVTFHLDGGPPELVLWSLDVIGLDYAREHVLMALPDHLSSAQEWVLLRHACTIAVQLEAMTPSLNDWGVLSGHDGSPMWYYAGVAELRLIVRRLSGERATNFDRIIAPVLANAEMLR